MHSCMYSMCIDSAELSVQQSPHQSGQKPLCFDKLMLPIHCACGALYIQVLPLITVFTIRECWKPLIFIGLHMPMHVQYKGQPTLNSGILKSFCVSCSLPQQPRCCLAVTADTKEHR